MKVFGEREERRVFFTHTIENANGARRGVGKANNLASGATQFTLHRLHALGSGVKVRFKKCFQNVHEIRAPSAK